MKATIIAYSQWVWTQLKKSSSKAGKFTFQLSKYHIVQQVIVPKKEGEPT